MTPEDDGQEDNDFWNVLGDRVLDPIQVPIIEALRWIAEPLSAIRMVDVLDGYLTMWEAADHLEALQALGIVGSTSTDPSSKRKSDFDVSYQLKTAASGSH